MNIYIFVRWPWLIPISKLDIAYIISILRLDISNKSFPKVLTPIRMIQEHPQFHVHITVLQNNRPITGGAN
jgi:hypothetical protein